MTGLTAIRQGEGWGSFGLRCLAAVALAGLSVGCAKRGAYLGVETIQDERTVLYRSRVLRTIDEPSKGSSQWVVALEDAPFHPTHERHEHQRLGRDPWFLVFGLLFTAIGVGGVMDAEDPTEAEIERAKERGQDEPLSKGEQIALSVFMGAFMGLGGILLYFTDEWVPKGKMARREAKEPTPGQGQPIANTLVSFSGPRQGSTINKRTDASGRVSVDLVQDLRLYVFPAGALPVTVRAHADQSNDASPTELSLKLRPSKWLHPGAVAGAKGAPICASPGRGTAGQVIRRAEPDEGITLQSFTPANGQLPTAAGTYVPRSDVRLVYLHPEAYASRFELESPPALAFSDARLEETAPIFPNGALDAGESGELVLQLSNDGNGTAFGVALELSGETRGILLAQPRLSVGDIAPGENREIRVPVAADLTLPSDTRSAHIRLTGTESRREDPAPVSITLPIRHFVAPALEIHETVEIVDAGGSGLANGIIDPDETVGIRVLIENRGAGEARQVAVRADCARDGVELLEPRVVLASIAPSRTETALFRAHFTTATRGTAIPLSFSVSEARDLSFPERRYMAQVSGRAPDVRLSATLGAGSAQELVTGEPFVLELRAENSGSLPAHEPTLVVRAAALEAIDARPIELAGAGGRFAPNDRSTHRLSGRVPRKMSEIEATFDLELRQSGHPPRTQRIAFPVRHTKPDLKVVLSLPGGGALQPGEEKSGTVMLTNVGDQRASDVRVTVRPESPLLTVKPRELRWSAIGPGATSEPRQMTVRAKGGHPPEETRIDFVVAQEIFGESQDLAAVTVLASGDQRVVARSDEADRSGGDMPTPRAPRSPRAPATAPSIALLSPRDGQVLDSEKVELLAVVQAGGGFKRLAVYEGDTQVYDSTRDMSVTEQVSRSPHIAISVRNEIALAPGAHDLRIEAWDLENRSSTEVVRVVRIDERGGGFELDPRIEVENLRRSRTRRPEGVAAIVGIEEYQHAESVPHAGRDALVFAEYATEVLGIPRERQILLLNHDASLAGLNKLFLSDLPKRVEPDRSDVFVYFAGHGMPHTPPSRPKGEHEPHLLPFDAVPDVQPMCYPLSRLRTELDSLNARSVTVAIDACFSGKQSRQAAIGGPGSGEKTMVEGGRFVGLEVVPNPPPSTSRLISLSAASHSQVAWAYEAHKHGLFTYFFLNGLRGAADRNGDDKISIGELESYLTKEVDHVARNELDKNQDPLVLYPAGAESSWRATTLVSY